MEVKHNDFEVRKMKFFKFVFCCLLAVNFCVLSLFAQNKPPKNNPAVITSLALSKKSVKICDCQPGQRPPGPAVCDVPTVTVRTIAADPENDKLTYDYTVSGGRITGTGANVKWDLSGVQPGTYTITAVVDDGSGVRGDPRTETVEVVMIYDACRQADECPELTVTGPTSAMRPGDRMTFTARISGGTQDDLSYQWTVDKGKIVSGQGTPTITVGTEGLNDETITARVSVRGDFMETCQVEASESGVIIGIPQPREVARLTNPNCDYHMAVLDSFFNDLQNDPTATGYIITFGTARAVTRMERQLRTYIRFRNFPAGRIVLVNGGISSELVIGHWIVPAGADSSSIGTDSPEPDVVKNSKEAPKPAEVKVEPEVEEPVFDPKEPYLFSEETYDGYVCYGGKREEIDLEGYAKILKEDPGSRGNIVIMLWTRKEYREKRREILKFLTGKGIARKRLRTFYVEGFGGVELWFLPCVKKGSNGECKKFRIAKQ
jgi:hypothetical protein